VRLELHLLARERARMQPAPFFKPLGSPKVSRSTPTTSSRE
jgi:hypothetical protein